MIKAVIVDDEINGRELLQQMLSIFCKNISLVGLAVDVQSGIQLIRDETPQIVFLDVEMPGGNGFAILDAFEKIDFKVIFVTGYDQYAIKAIKYAALDYLVKPIDVEELKTAVVKASTYFPDYDNSIQVLKSNLKNKEEEVSKIVISNDKNYHVIQLKDVLYIESDGNYIIFHLENSEKHISSKSLIYYQDLLPQAQFFRIHNSYIINIKAISSIENGRGGYVHLTNKNKLPIAFRRKPSFMQFIERNKDQ